MTDKKDTVEVKIVSDEENETEKIETTDSDKHKTEKKTKTKKKPSIQKKLQKKIEEQEEILKKVVEEREELRDKYLRSLAEIDNFRKRVKKEKEEFQKYVLSEFLLELLEVYNNLERALKSTNSVENNAPDSNPPSSNDEKSIISGVGMIYKQFDEVLKKQNVVEIKALNKVFDPNLHQALSKEERDNVSEPIVVEVYQKGFLYNGKLLKPTLAKVAVPKQTEEPEPETETETETETEEN
jgi:molecular chaperone GrpE